MKLFDAAISAVFPNTCAVCGEILSDGELFCDYCFEHLEETSKFKSCPKCGLRKSNCACTRHAFRFDGCTAPFYFEECSKRAMYAFKFGHRAEPGEFFARQMALSVMLSFHDISFDLVCCVPMLTGRRLRRGYNQSELLARSVSKILGLRFADRLLGCKRKRSMQHNLPNSMRFENVKDKYYSNYSVMGRTVLLVDDIKTTGATLDECARQLKLSGAAAVYCVTGIITETKEKKE